MRASHSRTVALLFTLFLVLLTVSSAPLASLSPSPAQAQEQPSRRRLGVSFRGGPAHLTFSARDLLNADAREKLASGLPQTVVMRVYAYAVGRTAPIAMSVRSCRVVYDLWEEVYRVQVASVNADRATTVSDVDEVLERCVISRRFPVGTSADYAGYRGRRVYFAVLFEFNPLSQDTVERIRRWLARPTGGRVQGEAFFGSFVSLFVNRRIGDAERVLRFRSQRVRVPR
ncbi:MAG: hypothetical protein DRJ42_15100 [Deltaproteobacteria bacterium]|nr:MAG: hypothetical protein DRJ42_15100 [Deltaproteobacteria bacterium]